MRVPGESSEWGESNPRSAFQLSALTVDPSIQHKHQLRANKKATSEAMSSSLASSCNAPKHHYDTCFNHWLKSYLLLIAPPLSNPSDTPAGIKERDRRNKAIQEHKRLLEDRCGSSYKQYQACLKGEIQKIEDLPELLANARREEPLEGWGGIKVASEADIK